jgi:hypothetical protein
MKNNVYFAIFQCYQNVDLMIILKHLKNIYLIYLIFNFK